MLLIDILNLNLTRTNTHTNTNTHTHACTPIIAGNIAGKPSSVISSGIKAGSIPPAAWA